MNYLVMEVHPAYAVVLDEGGRFLKTANFGYAVGDTVTDIVELRPPQTRRPVRRWMPIVTLTAAAACAALGFFGYYQPNYLPYGTLLVQINPEVLLTVSRTERVLELEGRNEDGRTLLAGYDGRGKNQEQVLEELVDRAIDLGYLSGGGTVSVTVDSDDDQWRQTAEESTYAQLNDAYGETIVIAVGDTAAEEVPEDEEQTVVIPVTPSQPAVTTPPETAQPSQPSQPQTPPVTPPPDDDDDDDLMDDADDNADDWADDTDDEIDDAPVSVPVPDDDLDDDDDDDDNDTDDDSDSDDDTDDDDDND